VTPPQRDSIKSKQFHNTALLWVVNKSALISQKKPGLDGHAANVLFGGLAPVPAKSSGNWPDHAIDRALKSVPSPLPARRK
jgi:hypothetical protein